MENNTSREMGQPVTSSAILRENNGTVQAIVANISAIWDAVADGFRWLSTNLPMNETFSSNISAFNINVTPYETAAPTIHSIVRTSTLQDQPEEYTFYNHSRFPTLNYDNSGEEFCGKNLTNRTNGTDRLYPFYPPYYDLERCCKLNITNDPLYNCENPGMAVVFSIFVLLLGTTAIVGNAILPIVIWKRRSMRTKQNFIKASLAFNDMISGFILIFSVFPNIIWFRNSTEKEVLQGIRKTYNSPIAILSASALIISLQGSLFHLVYLGADRYVAIKWPMWNRYRRKSTVVWTLVGIWVLTIVGSAVTAAFPKHFNYLYNAHVFMYTLGYERSIDNGAHGYIHFGLALFFPYIVTIILAVLTAQAAFKELKSFSRSAYTAATRIESDSRNGHSQGYHMTIVCDDNKRSERNGKPELAVVKTILIMTAAFICAWSVFFIIFFVSINAEAINESSISIVYTISFYSGLSNSVANVIIYSVRDHRFRAAVKATFFRKKKKSQWHSATTMRRVDDLSTKIPPSKETKN